MLLIKRIGFKKYAVKELIIGWHDTKTKITYKDTEKNLVSSSPDFSTRHTQKMDQYSRNMLARWICKSRHSHPITDEFKLVKPS